MPTIRYRTGDIGRLDPTPCPCGRGLPKIHAVEGRLLDFLVTPRGRVLHPTSAMHIVREISEVRESRIVQEDVDHVVVQLVPVHRLTETVIESLREKFRILFGPEIRVDIVPVDEIPRPASGKFRPVESKVSRQLIEEMLTTRS
jgi:phenylacetate-CoA ligase